MSQTCLGCIYKDKYKCPLGQEYDISSFVYEAQFSANYHNGQTKTSILDQWKENVNPDIVNNYLSTFRPQEKRD